MYVNLNFGFTGYVAVKDRNDRELYRQPVQSRQEADQWFEANKRSIQGWDILKSSIIPVRVDNFEDLAKDLFLPTFVNRALEINNLFLKVLASIVAIAWDVLTFPVRLIALPIRYASYTEPHMPVEELIKTSPHFAEAKKDGVVRLVYQIKDTYLSTRLGVIDQDTAAIRTTDASVDVCLKALPENREKDPNLSSYTKIFLKSPTGQWEG